MKKSKLLFLVVLLIAAIAGALFGVIVNDRFTISVVAIITFVIILCDDIYKKHQLQKSVVIRMGKIK